MEWKQGSREARKRGMTRGGHRKRVEEEGEEGEEGKAGGEVGVPPGGPCEPLRPVPERRRAGRRRGSQAWPAKG